MRAHVPMPSFCMCARVHVCTRACVHARAHMYSCIYRQVRMHMYACIQECAVVGPWRCADLMQLGRLVGMQIRHWPLQHGKYKNVTYLTNTSQQALVPPKLQTAVSRPSEAQWLCMDVMNECLPACCLPCAGGAQFSAHWGMW